MRLVCFVHIPPVTQCPKIKMPLYNSPPAYIKIINIDNEKQETNPRVMYKTAFAYKTADIRIKFNPNRVLI